MAVKPKPTNKDIKGLHLRFAETSVYGNYWLELTGGEEYAYYIDEIKDKIATISPKYDKSKTAKNYKKNVKGYGP